MVFVELPVFVRSASALFSDEALREMQALLLENPLAGYVPIGGRGLRKLRVTLPGRGKRGGARVIYYHWVGRERCYLVYAYAKNAMADLSSDQLRRLADAMSAELNDG